MGFLDTLKGGGKNINKGVEEYRKTDGAVLLDVRTEQEYKERNIPDSINIPLDRIMTVENKIKDKNTPLFVYCHSGMRSGKAVSYLKDSGYLNVKNIGGIANYKG